jgi:hypothetical protein
MVGLATPETNRARPGVSWMAPSGGSRRCQPWLRDKSASGWGGAENLYANCSVAIVGTVATVVLLYRLGKKKKKKFDCVFVVVYSSLFEFSPHRPATRIFCFGH